MAAEPYVWPFFTDAHRTLASELRAWALREAVAIERDADGGGDVDAACRTFVKRLGAAGWLRYAVPAEYGGVYETLDVRSLCIARETLARVSGLADFAFAMEGLGAGPISLFGSAALKARYLPRVATGDAIAAFAISEAEAGSDVAAMRTTARREGACYTIEGEKTWISNAGLADQYVVFCRLGDAEREFIALVVEPGDAGFSVAARIETIAPHPLGTLRFDRCRVPADRVVGEPTRGLRVALGTLDVFRSTVGAAALGFARRALDETLAHVTTRKMLGQTLDEFQLTQARIARMATAIDASALLIYRAAWTRDTLAPEIRREAAMAKMYATEAAQGVVDDAVQLLGGHGVVRDHPVEKLYREVRALRIYEGTTEVQQLLIARQVLDAYSRSQGRHG
ncbi:MAG TPA: acyl-CoA dehydrogenase family protein [Gemmatimonadaceae bacterium]|nr:acyl-CoA dehydrogenase family protein [Gemmatimonadaceae bacterium]